MDDVLFKIILGTISLLLTIVTGVVVPYIKEKIGNEKLKRCEEWADLAVRWAEMTFSENGMGKTKKEYVVNFLNEMFNKNKIIITPEQIDVLIEAAVKTMKSNEIKLEQII